MDASVVITTFKEDRHLARLLSELSAVSFDQRSFEILILDASNYSEEVAKRNLGKNADKLKFLSFPGLSRTDSLNKLFQIATGKLIIRLDARSSITPDYLEKIFQLALSTGAEVVGGTLSIKSLTNEQDIVAKLMIHPFCFGGANFRKLDFRGYVDSVYLGAFSASFLKEHKLTYDSVHPNISEDSDLNYRIRKLGGKIYMDSSIAVRHYPRENLISFFELCKNYGVGRGLFVLKHKQFMAMRQFIPPVSFLIAIALLIMGFEYDYLHIALFILGLLYFILILIASLKIARFKDLRAYIFGFIGAHFFWTLGFFISPYKYFLNLRRSHD